MTFHWVSNTPPPTHTHTHKAKMSKCTVWTSLVWRSRYLLCLDIGQPFLWMKRRSINYKIKIHVAMRGYCMNTPLDWKGKHLPCTYSMNWMIMLFTHLFVILSEGLDHTLSVVMILQAVEKNLINIKLYYMYIVLYILPARMSIPNQERPG